MLGDIPLLKAPSLPQTPLTRKSGLYIWGQLSTTTAAALGNGALRAMPFFSDLPISLVGIGAEFTVAGDAASVFRTAIFNDDGSGYPGALLKDGGSISTGSGNAGSVATGGTPGAYVNTIAQLDLPAGLYWVAGVLQGVTSTQPTMRVSRFMPFVGGNTVLPTGGTDIFGYTHAGVTGALPSQFNALANNTTSTPPRIILKLA